LNNSPLDRRPQIMKDLGVRHWGCVPRGILDVLASSTRRPDIRVLMTILIRTVGHEYQSPYALRFPKDEWDQYVAFKKTRLNEVCSNEDNVLRATHIAKHLKLDRSQLTRSLKKWKDHGIIDIRDGRIYLTSDSKGKEQASAPTSSTLSRPADSEQAGIAGAKRTRDDSCPVNHDVDGRINKSVDDPVLDATSLVDESGQPSLLYKDQKKQLSREFVSGVATHPLTHPDRMEDYTPELKLLKNALEPILLPKLAQAPDRNILGRILDALGGAPIEMLCQRVLNKQDKFTSYGLVVDLAKDCFRDRAAWERAAISSTPQRKRNLKAEAFALRQQPDHRGKE
jgi:hypothetical protein